MRKRRNQVKNLVAPLCVFYALHPALNFANSMDEFDLICKSFCNISCLIIHFCVILQFCLHFIGTILLDIFMLVCKFIATIFSAINNYSDLLLSPGIGMDLFVSV